MSLTATHGYLYGSAVVIDGLGLVLGHGMSRFEYAPGEHPNAPQAGKRMHHNMAPTLVMQDGRPRFAFEERRRRDRRAPVATSTED